MRCFKQLGERIMARDFDRRAAELQARAAGLNRFTHLARAHYSPYATSLFSEKLTRPLPYYCNKVLSTTILAKNLERSV
jgi:hypothetical protein